MPPRESLELHGVEMEKAFLWGPNAAYNDAVERIQAGGDSAEDVATVLKGPTPTSRNYRDQVLLLFPDASTPLTAMLAKLKALEPSEPL